MRGRFITLEGGEGAGKSTNMAFIRDFLTQAGVEVLTTREPGGTELGEELRSLLITPRAQPMDPMAELLMIFAARAQHLAQVIEPALARGVWVISDRFTDATYAYQGAGRQLGTEPVKILESLVQKEMRPDLTLILDLPIATGMERANSRAELDRFEQEKIAFFERVRQSYLNAVVENPQRYRKIDASQSLEAVQAQLRTILSSLVNSYASR